MPGRNTDEWRRAIEDLRSSGKVRYFGVSISEHDPDSALEAVKTGLVTAVQVIYNIFDQSAGEKPVSAVPGDEGWRAGARAAG